MTELDILTDDQAQFYTICLLMVLEHLHGFNICVRNLKPESITIDYHGYPKLCDFRESKRLNDKDRTHTTVGAPHYTSPEMIKGSGYDHRTDLWSLGCIIYEMICGKVPFGDDIESPHEVYDTIEHGVWEWPKTLEKNTVVCNFVEKLLNRNPQQRGSAHGLKDNNWFYGITYADYYMQQVQAPYIPAIDLVPETKIEGEFAQILDSHEFEASPNTKVLRLKTLKTQTSLDSRF